MLDPFLKVLKKIKKIEEKEEREVKAPYKVEPDPNYKPPVNYNNYSEFVNEVKLMKGDIELLKSEIRRLNKDLNTIK